MGVLGGPPVDDGSYALVRVDHAKLHLIHCHQAWEHRKKVSRPKSRYPNPSDLAVAFKRSARESGITNNLHLVDLRPAPQKSEP